MQAPTFEPGQSRLVTVRELLEFKFHIPPFQRPYDWGTEQVEDFIQDLRETSSRNMPLFLGLVVVCPGEYGLDIVDGQQRLTTLMLAVAARGFRERVLRTSSAGLIDLWVSPREADRDFTLALLTDRREAQKTLSQRLMSEAHEMLAMARDAFTDEALLESQIIPYAAPSLAGATSLFERINLRGKEVCQFDLVKNKLIEWAAAVSDRNAKAELERLITRRYDELYRKLDVADRAEPLDSDKLLKVHWILISERQFKSSDKVLEQFDATLKSVKATGGNIAGWIERYLNTLVEVAEAWVAVERPYEKMPDRYSKKLRDALLDFARLGRDGELQPLIVAAILRWDQDAERLIRFCEITSFRCALAQKNSNYGRSFKWRAGRQLYQRSWKNARGVAVTSAAEAVHQLYWNATPYWSSLEAAKLGEELNEESIAAEIFPDDALDSPHFYRQYRHVIHYLFWKYGKYLPESEEWATDTREDISPFQDSVWFEDLGFTTWDIEHIYPQTPDDHESKAGRVHMKNMAPWLHHLGNLTVLPIRDNRGMKNAPFIGDRSKLGWLRDQRKVSFNELLANASYRGNLMDRPHWGVNNCKKRVAQLQEAARTLWGDLAAIALGVGPFDARVNEHAIDVDEDDDAELVDVDR